MRDQPRPTQQTLLLCHLTLCCCCLFNTPLAAQRTPKGGGNVIYFNNPSFEDMPKAGGSVQGWNDCGSAGETPPDVQPGFFGVSMQPSHGQTYLGLVVRDNETWEGVWQNLSTPLKKDFCYEFEVSLCRSERLISQTKLTQQPANFNKPVHLRVWGGNGLCSRAELLYITDPIDNLNWMRHTIPLKPQNNSYTSILIEAYFQTPTMFPYNGNLLVDDLSPIQEVPCKKKTPKPKPVNVLPPVVPLAAGPRPQRPSDPKPTQPNNPPTSIPQKTDPVTTAQLPPSPPLDRKNLGKGKVFRLNNVYFDANRYDIKPASEAALGELATLLLRNPDMAVEIGGHTNNNLTGEAAKNLSSNRAKAVADWLISRGIAAERVQYKGYGETQPVVPNEGVENKKKNQRVEVTVLN